MLFNVTKIGHPQVGTGEKHLYCLSPGHRQLPYVKFTSSNCKTADVAPDACGREAHNQHGQQARTSVRPSHATELNFIIGAVESLQTRKTRNLHAFRWRVNSGSTFVGMVQVPQRNHRNQTDFIRRHWYKNGLDLSQPPTGTWYLPISSPYSSPPRSSGAQPSEAARFRLIRRRIFSSLTSSRNASSIFRTSSASSFLTCSEPSCHKK